MGQAPQIVFSYNYRMEMYPLKPDPGTNPAQFSPSAPDSILQRLSQRLHRSRRVTVGGGGGGVQLRRRRCRREERHAAVGVAGRRR